MSVSKKQSCPWTRRGGPYHSVLEYLQATTGMTERELVSPEKVPAETIENIPRAAAVIRDCLEKQMPVLIAGDYDADGVTSSAILYLLFRQLGVTAQVRIPRRISEGYGINERIIRDLRGCLLLCVDNGIAAGEIIRRAREQGNVVVILDHHLAGEDLPEAEAIVDPHVTGGVSGYEDYCGAGLALKLAEYMLGDPSKNRPFFYPATVLAAMGTVGDIMPLTGDNRRIVKDGLAILNNRAAFSLLPWGIRELFALLEKPYDENTIAFEVTPMINAVGRLYDAGSLSALKTLLCSDPGLAAGYAGKLKEINEDRKAAVSKWSRTAENCFDISGQVQVIRLQKAPEGILGIIAGRLCESWNTPVIVVTDSLQPGILKGSGRAPEGFHLFEAIQAVKEYTIVSGGHAGAAGLTLQESALADFTEAIGRYAEKTGWQRTEPVACYDLEIDESQALDFYLEMQKYKPYGEGCRQPVYMVRGYHSVRKFGYDYRLLGEDGIHLKLFGAEMDVVAWRLGQKFTRIGSPEVLHLLGALETNAYGGQTTLQFKAEDISPA